MEATPHAPTLISICCQNGIDGERREVKHGGTSRGLTLTCALILTGALLSVFYCRVSGGKSPRRRLFRLFNEHKGFRHFRSHVEDEDQNLPRPGEDLGSDQEQVNPHFKRNDKYTTSRLVEEFEQKVILNRYKGLL